MKSALRWIPALLIMIFIYFVSGTPGPAIQQAGLGNEKLHVTGHFLMFCALYLSYYYATKKLLLSLLLAVLYGFFDEYHQKFIYLRSPSLFDIKINSLGSLTGLVVAKLSKKIFEHENNSKLQK